MSHYVECATFQPSDYATSVKVEALAQLGRMLREMPKAKGGQPYQSTSTTLEPVAPTLSDLGLDKKTSKLAQNIASDYLHLEI